MKRKITIFALSFFMLIAAGLKAQVNTYYSSNDTRSKFYLSAHVATQGLGLELKYSPVPDFNVRGGASILPFKGDMVYSVNSSSSDVNIKADFANAHLMLDWHPFLDGYKFSRKIVVTGGAAYFWKDKGNAVVSHKGPYKYGDIVIPSSEIGELRCDVQWNKVAPYAGFGFENAFPNHKFNIGFAIGAYYMGAPDVSLVGTKLLERNTGSANEEQLRKNMSFYQLLPVVQINLNFGL